MRSFIYILASHSDDPVLYIGVTSDLERRLAEHQMKITTGFAEEYRCDRLVYFEEAASIEEAIAREKQLKRWHRQWKLNLIKGTNPRLRDLSLEWRNQEILKRVQDDIWGQGDNWELAEVQS